MVNENATVRGGNSLLYVYIFSYLKIMHCVAFHSNVVTFDERRSIGGKKDDCFRTGVGMINDSGDGGLEVAEFESPDGPDSLGEG
jgi:hypothetical protein